MKFKKLTIHNIASIEDAVVDFEKEPLAGSGVFLISGKTGAGKSTILDAVSLALFAKTPRLANTNMQGKVIDSGGKELTLSRPEQLLRRNKGEGYVDLEFEGNDDKIYSARWEISRSRLKPEGSLRDKKWILTDYSTGLKLDKDRDVAAAVQKAIGLNFEQFCRTTMLAQGDFSRFLNSSDDDKASILEKITGTDIYTKIGIAIYRITNTHKALYESEERLLNNISFLSDEEKLAFERQLLELESENSRLRDIQAENQSKIDWLKNEEIIHKEIIESKRKYREALDILTSEAFKSKEKIVNDWDKTRDIRNVILTNEQAKIKLRDNESRLEEEKITFRKFLEGYYFELNELKRLNSDRKEIDIKIEELSDKKLTFENYKVICARLRKFAELRGLIHESNQIVEAERNRLAGELKIALENAENVKKVIADELIAREREIDTAEKQIAELNLSRLREEFTRITNVLADLRQLTTRVDVYLSDVGRLEDRRNLLKETQCLIKAGTKDLAVFKENLSKAEIDRNTSKAVYEAQLDTIDKYARAMRAKLRVGDTCPVCRQKIAESFVPEDQLLSIVANYEKIWKDSEGKFQEAERTYNKSEAYLNQLKESAALEIKRIEKDDAALNSMFEILREECEKYKIETVDNLTLKRLKQLEEFNLNSRNRIEHKIKAGDEKLFALTNLRNETDIKRKELDLINKDVKEAEDNISKTVNKINVAQQIAENLKSEKDGIEDELQGYLSQEWEEDWKEKPQEFALRLEEKSISYEKLLRNKSELELSVVKSESLCKTLSGLSEKLLGMMPGWANLNIQRINRKEDMVNLGNQLLSDISSLLQAADSLNDLINSNNNAIDSFINGNDKFTIDSLKELNEIPTDEIDILKKEIDVAHDNVKTTAALLQSIERQYKLHSERRPAELNEKDDIENLTKLILENSQKDKEVTESIGRLKEQLDSDSRKHKEFESQLDRVQNLKSVYDRWNNLNSLLGSSDGKKFRTIAQSYVLESLIHSANHYMKTLSGRYILKIQPGTFVILVEDKYQGSSLRAAGTLSGGETFLVSLALALALSDIGDRLGVDTLFIDEGFGTLSGEPLQKAIETLQSLHVKTGKHVGIISHVEELREKIPVQIVISQQGASSSSKVSVTTNK